MNRADQVKTAMNLRQRYRCYRSEMLAYSFRAAPFRAWYYMGGKCNVHQDWKPGTDFLPRRATPRPAYYPQRVNDWNW